MGRLLTAIDPRLCQSATSLPLTTCEQVYYLGAPLAHVIAYEQRLRETRLDRYAALARRRSAPKAASVRTAETGEAARMSQPES